MFNLGPEEIILILVIALIVFGPKRLPEIGRTVGKSLREFKRASDEIKDELNLHMDDETEPPTVERSYPDPAAPAQAEPVALAGEAPSPNGQPAGAEDPGSQSAGAGTAG